jgi:ribose transport system permease protein
MRARARALTPFITLLVLVTFFAVFSVEHRFIVPANLLNIIMQASSVAIMATGITFVLLIGEIDLSIGGIATATGVFSAWLLVSQNWPDWVCVLAGIILGLIFGFINGFVISRISVPSFMTTLATGIIATGLAMFLTKGRPIFDVPEISSIVGGGRNIIAAAAVILIIGTFIARYTRFGRYVYMVGSSREAATMSGVSSKNITLLVMMLCGFLAGLAGVINTGRLGSANADIFADATLDTIAAVVLGGTSLFGGVGSVPYTIIGLLVLGVLKNGLNLVKIDVYLKQMITGLILLVALILNVYALRLGQAEQEAIC